MITDTRVLFEKYTDAETFSKIVEMDTISEMWNKCIKEYSDICAIVDSGKEYTYSQLENDAADFRTSIINICGKEPKRIGLFCPNSYDFAKAFIAITTLGHTAVVLPAQLPGIAVMGICMQCGIDTLVYAPSLEANIKELSEKMPTVKLLNIETVSGIKSSMRDCHADTPCVVMFTGGTTGKSKGAVLNNGALMQGVVNGCYGYQDVFNQRYLLVLPLSHVFGLIRSFLTVLYTGGTICICRNNADMFRDAAMFKPQVLVSVPALVEMALALSKKFGKMMLGSDMKYIICGAAPVAPYLVTEYAKHGITLFPGYGLTESANLVSGNSECQLYPDAVGIPYPNQELRFENGELWIKGKNLFSEYIGVSKSETFEDGWFKTGDLAHMDEKGLLYITGRIKEIIILSNGENISPAEVEAHFNKLSFVSDSQVFEDEDGTLALEILPREAELAVIAADDANAYMIEQIKLVNRELPTYQRVNRIIIRDKDFERTPSMKIVRYKK